MNGSSRSLCKDGHVPLGGEGLEGPGMIEVAVSQHNGVGRHAGPNQLLAPTLDFPAECGTPASMSTHPS